MGEYQLTIVLPTGEFVKCSWKDREHIESALKEMTKALESDSIDTVVCEMSKFIKVDSESK